MAALFIRLHLGDSHTLRLTPTHHLPVGAECCAQIKMAKDVTPGDLVWLIDGDSLVARPVLHLSSAVGSGLHNPLMLHGGFPVVERVVTSSNTGAVVARNALLVPLVEPTCPWLARRVVAAFNPKTMHYIDGVIVEPFSVLGCALGSLATLALLVAALVAVPAVRRIEPRAAKI